MIFDSQEILYFIKSNFYHIRNGLLVIDSYNRIENEGCKVKDL